MTYSERAIDLRQKSKRHLHAAYRADALGQTREAADYRQNAGLYAVEAEYFEQLARGLSIPVLQNGEGARV